MSSLPRLVLQPAPAPVPQQDPLIAALARVPKVVRVGKVAEAYGTMIRATGLKAMIGELCELRSPRDRQFRLAAEVVGVSRQYTLLTPLGPLDGVAHDTEVVATGRQAWCAAATACSGASSTPTAIRSTAAAAWARPCRCRSTPLRPIRWRGS